MALFITQGQLSQVKELNAAGDVAGAWQLLKSFGDKYAAAAYDVVADPSSFYGSMVRSVWYATSSDLSKFDAVALLHQNQYLRLIESSESGTRLPTTTQIEKSYYEALRAFNITPYAAIDFAVSLTGGALFSWANWYACNGIRVRTH